MHELAKWARMPAEHGGVGWTLVPDLEAIETIERIIAALAEGDSPLTIARALNADGVLSPSAHWAAYRARTKHNGAKPEDSTHPKRKRKPAQWRDKTIVKILTSPAIMGWKIHRGNPVRDDQGAPVLAAENAILTREEFDSAEIAGKLAPVWKGIPLLDAGQKLDGTDVLPLTAGTSGKQTGDIYAVRFGSTEADSGVTGLTNGGVQTTDLGESHDKPVYRTRIDLYCGLALFGGKAAARLTNALVG
ncbi:recombinase family protein [Streptomyces sp. cg36]|uniref:recombinase family protein n=1 Tax=Streptomyces sp. cg36 TaxID=3238798 RepID=UPI0034E2A1E4